MAYLTNSGMRQLPKHDWRKLEQTAAVRQCASCASHFIDWHDWRSGAATGETTTNLTPPAERLAVLAAAVAPLSPSRRDPEQFHEDKSEIAAELRRLAREIAA
jgi:hypothetical protein